MNALEHIAIGIRVQTTHTTRKYEYRGEIYVLVGKCVECVDLRIPTIEILTVGSTPNNPKIDLDSERLFNKQSEKLIETGERFYTALRANWCIPMIEWRLER